ncbi:hypothetical protein G3M48_006455 [Beauveria asiatica]|uniref:Uncharacterized protein n=1 Tax=Beauveria asiatica TaxID=1069075 RepID=A0AAW0S5Q7_9HYPO
MASFLYSTKNADSSIHQLPLSLDRESVLGLLHNDALLPRILWPNTIMADKQQTLSGIKGILTDSNVHASLLKLTDGLSCVEKVGGFTMTVSYIIVDGGEATGDVKRSRCLRLREERSIRALKPIASFTKFKNESPVKTRNLLRFFEAFSQNGADSMAALESIAVADSNNDKQKASYV